MAHGCDTYRLQETIGYLLAILFQLGQNSQQSFKLFWFPIYGFACLEHWLLVLAFGLAYLTTFKCIILQHSLDYFKTG